MPAAEYFSCPSCGTSTALEIDLPVWICCPNCHDTYEMDEKHTLFAKMYSKFEADPVARIRIGDRGIYAGTAFRITGVVRSFTTVSIDHEWLMLFEDGRWMWLVDSCFHYFLVDAEETDVPITFGSNIEPGKMVTVNGNKFLVTDKYERKGARRDGQVKAEFYTKDRYRQYDLFSLDDKSNVTINEYSQKETTMQRGRRVAFDELKLTSSGKFQK